MHIYLYPRFSNTVISAGVAPGYARQGGQQPEAPTRVTLHLRGGGNAQLLECNVHQKFLALLKKIQRFIFCFENFKYFD